MTGLMQALTARRCPRRQSGRQPFPPTEASTGFPGAAAALNLHVCSGSKVRFLGTPRDIDHCQFGCPEQLYRGIWERKDGQEEPAIPGSQWAGGCGPGVWLLSCHLVNFGEALPQKGLGCPQHRGCAEPLSVPGEGCGP